MIKKFLAIFTIAFVLITAIVVPFSGQAEESTARAQGIATFEHSLYFGMHGNAEVSDLQELLTDQGFYAGPINGNFYLMTLQAVRKFQSANNISATGFFGPKSRVAANDILKQLIGDVCMNEDTCSDTILPNPQLTITTTDSLEATVGQRFVATFTVNGGTGNYTINGSGDIPGLNFTGTYCPPVGVNGQAEACAQVINPNTITLVGAPTTPGKYMVTVIAHEKKGPVITCITTPCDQPGSRYGKANFTIYVNSAGATSPTPTIKEVSGPTTLKVNQEGTWTIKASNANGGSLTYRVEWGDQGAGASVNAARPQSQNFVQTATFAHTYANTGVYTPTFYVMNEQGGTTHASLSVKVGDGVATNSIKVLDPNGGEKLLAGGTYPITWGLSTNMASTNERRTIRISLLQQVQCIKAPCNDPETVIADNIEPSQGKDVWVWSIPTTMTTGMYRVKVALMSGYDCPLPPHCDVNGACAMYACDPAPSTEILSDTSDNYFTIVGPSTGNAVSLTDITPARAGYGATVTLSGKGFTDVGNIVYIDGADVLAYNVASKGETLTFTVPEYTGPECLYVIPSCKVASKQLQPGTYKVWVKNAKGVTSDGIMFTVVTKATS